MFTSIFQCVPISSQWDPEQAEGARCLNYPFAILVGGTINSLTSIFILLLPVPLVWKLSMCPQKKRLVILIFALGGG